MGYVIYYIKLQYPYVCTPFFRHDRRTAPKFGTHIRVDTGLAHLKNGPTPPKG